MILPIFTMIAVAVSAGVAPASPDPLPATAPAALVTSVPALPTPQVAFPHTSTTTVRTTLESYYRDIPIMVQIARCESRFRHFDKNDTPIKGEINSLDIGVMQINAHYHAERALSLGLDIYDFEDNLAYARILYNEQGSAPWISSSACWGKKK